MINSYVALDIETTGLNPKLDKIIEIGAVKVLNGIVTDTYETFVNPNTAIPERITELTGITDKMAGQGKTQEKAVQDFIEFCEDFLLLGHNILFDFSFIRKCAVNMGVDFQKQGIDTLKIARRFLPELESKKLEYLCEYYKIPHETKHRAYCDARASGILYERLYEQFGEKDEEGFKPLPLIYQVKKEGPITPRQKAYLYAIVKYHRLELGVEIEAMTKNEASRLTDQLLSTYGKLPRRSL